MIIKYICECCERIVEEIVVSEDIVTLLDDEQDALTGQKPEDIINLGSQDSLVLQSICGECLAEINLAEDGELSFGTPVIN